MTDQKPESRLQTLSQQWQTIKDRQESVRFYNEAVFPTLCEVVVAREQAKYTQPYPFLISTVGMSPEPIILSIRILRPQRVYLLYTSESESVLERIFKESGLRLSQVDKDEIVDTNVPGIYQKVKDIYARWEHPQRIAVDITGGKKSMVGACALAGSLIGARLFYMDFKYLPDLLKPLPGSEQLRILENPYDVFGDLKLQRAQDLFTELDFTGAEHILDELRHQTSTPDFYEARQYLCQAYASWDDWRIDAAYAALNTAVEAVKKYGRSNPHTPLNGQLPRLKEQLGVLERLQQALKLEPGQAIQLLQQPELYQPMIGTLRACALRQEYRGKLDVATLLWYRLVELLSQRRLSHYGLLTKQADYTAMGMDQADLLNKYQRAYESSSKKSKVHPPETLPKDIALLDGYILLTALADPFVKHIHLGKIRHSIDTRNHGIFAHGFKPLPDADYQTFKELVVSLMDAFAAIEPAYQTDWEACEFTSPL
jgi:CRISPR-associated protein (TIGR02710 family)